MQKLIAYLQRLFAGRFYGTVTIKFESGKVTHVDVETRRSWQYKDLPGDQDGRGPNMGSLQALQTRRGGQDAA